MTPGSHAPTHVADFPGIEAAACAGTDTDLWFPVRGDHRSIRLARIICNSCPVQVACLEYAVDNHEIYGIWGSTTEGERRRMRRQRNRP